MIRKPGKDPETESGDPSGGTPAGAPVENDHGLPSRGHIRRLPWLIVQAFALVRRAAPRQLMLAGGLQVLAGVSLAAQLWVMRRFIDQVMASNGSLRVGMVLPELILFGVLLTIVAFASVAQREQQRILSELVQKYTTGLVMDVATRVDLIDFDRPTFYDRLERARMNASSRPLQIAQGVIGLLGSGAAVLAVGTALIIIEPSIAGLVVLGGLPAMFLNRIATRALHAYSVEQIPGDRRRAYLYTTLTRKEEAQEIRAFASGPYLRDQYEHLFDERIAATRRIARLRLGYGGLAGALTAMVTVGSLGLLLLFVRTGRLSISDAAVAIGALIIVAGRLRAVVASGGSLYEGALFLSDFTAFVSLGEQQAAKRPLAAPGAFSELELDGVSFTYPSRSEPSLHDVSLKLRHGEVIALVGENGSGKTTLTKLLAGLYRPTQGIVRWNGADISSDDLSPLREQVTVIFQDFARYFLTASENIMISRTDRDANEQVIRDAARLAGADDFLASLPGGYGSLLGPAFIGGSDLSIGQWQRVALARAYFRDSPMLILDEPTASLDPRGEYDIFQQVRRLAHGHTVVLVSHRFSSVRGADRILVLDGGRIVEGGDHDSLMRHDGLYAELFRLQADGYREVPS